MTAIAAVKASEADLLNIETCMRRTTEVRNDEDWIKWDGAFHLAIAKATRNDVLVGLITAFNEARSSGDWQALRLADRHARETTQDDRPSPHDLRHAAQAFRR